MLLIPLEGVRSGSTLAQYERTRQLFVHGYLEKCQLQADREYRRTLRSDPALARKFLLLEAEAMEWQDLDEKAYEVLSQCSPSGASAEELIKERTLEGVALHHVQQFAKAQERFSEAESLCAIHDYAACGDLLRARGAMSIARGDLVIAHEELLGSLAHARKYKDQLAEASAFLNLGVISLRNDHLDDAVDWSNAAYRLANELGSEDLAQTASGNLGWAIFKLGDSERALQLFSEAEKNAIRLGDPGAAIGWLATSAYVYQSTGELERA